MDDSALVLAVLRGESEAFSALYRAHVRSVYHVIRSTSGDHDAADVVQEVFVRALERLATLREPDRFRPWLLSIARHAATDHRRARAREASLDSLTGDVADREQCPEGLYEVAELADLVNGCVSGLAGRDATALTLVTRLGYSVAEIGQVFGVSHGAAKVLLHRARRRLRDALALEVLAHAAAGCHELRAMGGADLLAAGRHVRTCRACLEAASDEVELYGARAGSPKALHGKVMARGRAVPAPPSLATPV